MMPFSIKNNSIFHCEDVEYSGLHEIFSRKNDGSIT